MTGACGPRLLRVALAAALAAALLGSPPAAPASDRNAPCPANFGVRATTVAYGPQSDEQLDLFVPQGRPQARLLVFVHGGGWRTGSRKGYAGVGNAFASCGIAVATLDYTLAPAAQADAMARQIALAVAWLERNAQANGYASAPVFLCGHSAGAQLVAYVATLGTKALDGAGVAPATIGGAILLDGVFYDPPPVARDAAEAVSLAPIFGDMSTWSQRYGLTPKLTGREAPMLVVHGTSDTVVPEEDSRAFYDALRRAGDAADYLQPPDLTHGEVALQLFSPRTDLFARILGFVDSGTLPPP